MKKRAADNMLVKIVNKNINKTINNVIGKIIVKTIIQFIILTLFTLFSFISVRAEETQQILETRWNGSLGLFYTVANEALATDLKIQKGSFLITGVVKGSSAEKGMVKRGDSILNASGGVWNTEGVTGALKISRHGEQLTVDVTTTKHTLKNIQLVVEKEADSTTNKELKKDVKPKNVKKDVKPKNVIKDVKSKKIVVDASGIGDFLTITGAIISANPGDTIIVNNGVYREGIILTSGIKVEAKEKGGARIEAGTPIKIAGVSDVTIQGVSLAGTATTLILFDTKKIFIKNLSITSEKGTGIYVENSRDVNIEESIFMGKEETTAIKGPGIKLENSQAKILNNIISGYTQAILIAFSSEGEISSNLFDGNASAISVVDSQVSANKNTITGVGSDSGIWLKNSTGILSENFIRRQKTAIWGSMAKGSAVGNSITQNEYGIVLLSGLMNIFRNAILNNRNYGVWLSGRKTPKESKEVAKNLTISGNTISGNGGTGIYVSDFTTKIKYNLLEGNWNGILIEEGTSTIQNNTVVLQKGTGVWLDSHSIVTLYNNIISHNSFGIRSNREVKLKTAFNNVSWNFANKEFPLRDGNFAREDWLPTKGGEKIRIVVYPAYDLKGATDMTEDPGFVKLGKDYRVTSYSPLAKKKGKDNSFIGAFPIFKKR